MVRIILVDSQCNAIASLIPAQEVKILEPFRKKQCEKWGIRVNRAFAKEHGIQGKDLKVYPNDDPAIFAIAFQHFYLGHGLPYGWQWIDEEEYEKRRQISKLSDQELANMVLEIWKNSHSE